MITKQMLKLNFLCSNCRIGFEKLSIFAPHKLKYMFKKSLIIIRGLLIFAIGMFLFSCNTSIEIAKRHYQSGYYVSIHKKHNDSKQSSSAKVTKEIQLQNINPITLQTVNKTIPIIENPRILLDKVATPDNSSPLILNNNRTSTSSEIATTDNEVYSSTKKTFSKSFANGGGGDVGFYLSRWLIYLGLALISTFIAILLIPTSAQGFCILLFVIGGVLLLMSIIYFIKWVAFL